MSGHATADQEREIRARAAALGSASSADDFVDLALLYLEPAHQDGDAVALLERLLQWQPGNAVARIWLAYALLHMRLDGPPLQRAAEVLMPLLDESAAAGAAHMLLAEVRDEQGGDLAERISLLERSVALEPDWVNNRQDLAWAYSEAGRHADSAAQLQAAMAAVRDADPGWGLQRREFEESITGRTAAGARDRLAEDLRQFSGHR